MSPQLYLDSARLGQFAPTARLALEAFLDFAGSAPTMPELFPWLRGERVHPDSRQLIGEPLADWQGLRALEQALAERMGAREQAPVYLASRSMTLIRLGIRQLVKRCRRCLTLDTCWPAYLRELQQAAARLDDSIFVKCFRRSVYDMTMSEEEVCDQIAMIYVGEGCDGLFLPSVDFWGTRIPVKKIVDAIHAYAGEVRFVMLDAAQGLAHVPLEDDCSVADFIVAGSHKWLGSYLTLGMAVAPKPSSACIIEEAVSQALRRCQLDDGLLSFLQQLNGRPIVVSETVNLCPLFATFGALAGSSAPTTESLGGQIRNADLVCAMAESAGWYAIRPTEELRTGILLLQLPCQRNGPTATELQTFFADRSISLTAYSGGLIRLALPVEPLTPESASALQQALGEAAVAYQPASLLAG